MKMKKAARAAGEERAKRALMKQRQVTQRVSLENLFDTLKAGEVKTVNVIIKADVQGSVEALAASLLKIDVEGVKVSVVHSAVGAINESDVTLAEASNAFIIGFNVRPTPQARQQAETDEVEIRLHSIIYKVIEEVEDAMKGMLDPEYKEKIIGEAIIRETFKVSKLVQSVDSWLQVVKSLVMLTPVSSVMVSLSSTENLLALNTSKMTLKKSETPKKVV